MRTSPALRWSRRVTPVLHFDTTADSDINCGAIHQTDGTFWFSTWFKLDDIFDDTAPGVMNLLGNREDGSNKIELLLNNADGTITWRHNESGPSVFSINTGGTQTSWKAGTKYHVIASLSAVEGIRLVWAEAGRNHTVVTDADTTAISVMANLFIGSLNGLGTHAFGKVMYDVSMGTDDLTVAEERGLLAGIIPADATQLYRLNEGHGTTAIDLKSGDDGIIGSANTWETGLRQYIRY